MMFQIVKSGSLGFHKGGTAVKILPDNVLYIGVMPEDADTIVQEHLVGARPVDRLIYKKEGWQKQMRLVLRNCGVIDPEIIDEYINRSGYTALEKVLFDMSEQQVLDELKNIRPAGQGRGRISDMAEVEIHR